MTQKNMGDMHEGYEVGWEALDPKSNDSERSNDGAMAGANVWPMSSLSFEKLFSSTSKLDFDSLYPLDCYSPNS
jgi:hypothetical protein